jgi:carbamoyl-phosphate synthase large subunit
MRSLTLLLLSGGGHTGTNVMVSLASRRKELRLVATSDTPDEPALFAFDAVYLAPKLADETAAFERRILEIIGRESPHLVIPCRDEDVQWLAGLRERRHDLGATLLCGALDIADVINDKWRSSEFATRHGLPFAPSLSCIDDDDAPVRVAQFVREHGLPLVAKPRRGMDSKGVLILTSQAQALSAMRRPDYLLQKYLGQPETPAGYLANVEREGIPLIHSFEGVKRSLQVLIGPGGSIEHVVCTRNQRIRHNARAISMDDDAEPQRIGVQCARAFAEAGWRGPLNIQCQPTEAGTLMIHEFNARFTGATGARWHIGHDEIGGAIRAFTGRVIVPAFPWTEAPTFSFEGLMPRAADRGWARALAERGEWTRENR